MITLREVSKRFGRVVALSGISLELPEGSVTAVLGPNGSGKSTLLRLVAGLAKPTAGTVLLGTRAPADSKPRIGYLGHEPFVYRYLSAPENLRFYADLYGVDRAAVPRMLEQVGLAAKKDALVRTFSRGQAQRLGLARALLHDPDFLLLDEPFSGLDEAASEMLPDLVARPDRTIVLTTHDGPRAAAVADRMVRLQGGRLA